MFLRLGNKRVRQKRGCLEQARLSGSNLFTSCLATNRPESSPSLLKEPLY